MPSALERRGARHLSIRPVRAPRPGTPIMTERSARWPAATIAMIKFKTGGRRANRFALIAVAFMLVLFGTSTSSTSRVNSKTANYTDFLAALESGGYPKPPLWTAPR